MGDRMTTVTTVLAIDPGPTKSAFVVWDGKRILSLDKIENEKLVSQISQEAEWGHSFSSGSIDHLAVEMIASYGMPVGREVFETCVWIGHFVEAWGGPHTLVYRREVKLELCNSARAKDPNVRRALIDLVGPVGTKREPGPCFGVHSDIWAALGVAVTYHATKRDGGNLTPSEANPDKLAST